MRALMLAPDPSPAPAPGPLAPVASAFGTLASDGPAPDAFVPARRPRVVTLATIAAALGAIALIVPEVWLAGGGLVWALTGLLHLSPLATVALAAVVGLPVMVATVAIVRLAFEAETDAENAGH